MPHAPRPEPEPLKTDDVRIAAVGTAGWIVAFVVLLVIGLPSDERWWLWVCATGAVIGVFACLYIPRLKRKRSEAEHEHGEPSADDEPAAR